VIGECTSTFDLALFAAGGLTDDRAAVVAEHLIGCASCGQILADIAALDEEPVTPEIEALTDQLMRVPIPKPDPTENGNRKPDPIPFPGRRYLAIAAGLLLAASGTWFALRPKPVDTLLAQAYTKVRPFDWQLPNAGYSPVRVEMAESRTESAALQQAGIEVENREASAPSDGQTHELRGRLELLRHDASGAVAALEKALAASPANPEIESELGVAYALRARADDRPQDYETALGHFSAVLGHQPKDARTLFNRGVTYRLMRRKAEAASDFEAFLKLDGSSGWASEAREWIAELR
jgi:tetratricopeptide (TPR) repeat protein